MNPFDDYAALRPDAEPPTPESLDRLWHRSLTADSLPSGIEHPAGAADVGRRRVAVLGAAALLIVGITAVAFVAGRAEAPTGVADTAATLESSAPAVAEQPRRGVEVMEPPTWTVTEPGWVSTAPLVSFDPGVAVVTLVSGPEGVAESWVAIVDGVSDPLVSAGGLAADFPRTPVVVVPGLDEPPAGQSSPPSGEASESEDPIIAWRTDPAVGNYIVSAGGVPRSVAQDVFAAVRAGVALPAGFTVLPEGYGSLAQRRVTQRLEHPDGRWIEIDVQSGGQPRYDVEMKQATATEFFEPPSGVEVSNIALVGEYTLLLRTGFWVSIARTSASSDEAADFRSMIELVGLEPGNDTDPGTASTTPLTTSS